MRIYCPKCKVGYEIDETLIPEEGKKLRCSYCNETFVAHKEDLIATSVFSKIESEEKKESAEEKPSEESLENEKKSEVEKGEVKEIFERLAEQSENLAKEEQNISVVRKIFRGLYSFLGLNRRLNRWFFSLVLIVLAILLLYNYKYEIVRTLPFMNSVYKIAGVKAKIPGEGLEFQNVTWNLVDENNNSGLEVKGFIYNPTDKEIEVPMMKIEMLDDDASSLQTLNQKPALTSLKPGGRLAVSVIIKTPVPNAKYVYMTFIE